MSTLAQLSAAAHAALEDADRCKARVAAQFLRVQIKELFRLAHQSKGRHESHADRHPAEDKDHG
jgi:hypothetical protein